MSARDDFPSNHDFDYDAAMDEIDRLRDEVDRRILDRAELWRRHDELRAEMATMHRTVVHECCERAEELRLTCASLRVDFGRIADIAGQHNSVQAAP